MNKRAVFTMILIIIFTSCTSSKNKMINRAESFWQNVETGNYEQCWKMYSERKKDYSSKMRYIMESKAMIAQMNISDIKVNVYKYKNNKAIMKVIILFEDNRQHIAYDLWVKENGTWKIDGGLMSLKDAEKSYTLKKQNEIKKNTEQEIKNNTYDFWGYVKKQQISKAWKLYSKKQKFKNVKQFENEILLQYVSPAPGIDSFLVYTIELAKDKSITRVDIVLENNRNISIYNVWVLLNGEWRLNDIFNNEEDARRTYLNIE